MEMEYLNGISTIVEVYGHKLSLELLYVFLPSFFRFFKMIFMNRLEFSCFADYFVKILKTREEYGFL
jgi:hypothetical protein